jgi:hypothetical protein
MTNTYQLPVIDVESVPVARYIEAVQELEAEQAKMARDVAEFKATK